MFASMTTTHGSAEDILEVGRMTGETMVEWLRELDGFAGLVMLSSEETGTTHVISLWSDRATAERHRASRLRLRDLITSAVSVEVQETEAYAVSFAEWPPARSS